MKKIIGMIAGLLVVMLLIPSCGAQSLPDKFDEDTVKAEAEKAIGYFNGRDYQSILDMGNDAFQDAITLDSFETQSNPYLDKCGEYQEIAKTIVLGNVDKATEKQYGGVVMVGKYENGTIQFTIGFDEDMKLVQFFIK